MTRGWRLLVYLFSYALSQSGDWLFMFVIPWIIMGFAGSEENSAKTITTISLMSGIAALIGGFFAPLAINRAAKTKLLIILNIGLAIISAALALSYANALPFIIIVFLLVFKSAFVGVTSPVDSAFSVELFPESDKRRWLVGIKTRMMHGARILVYFISGYLLAKFGASFLLFWDAVSFLIVAVVFYFVASHQPPKLEKNSSLILWSKGLHFLGNSKSYLNMLIILFLLQYLGTSNFSLTPVLTKKEFGWDAFSLGLIMAAGGIGGFLGSFNSYVRWTVRKGLLYSVSLFCITSFLLPLANNVWLAFLCYLMIVLVNTPMFIQIITEFQEVEEEYRDSILSISSMILLAFAPIARLIAVYVNFELLGLNTSSLMLFNPVLSFLLVCLVYFRSKPEIDSLYVGGGVMNKH